MVNRTTAPVLKNFNAQVICDFQDVYKQAEYTQKSNMVISSTGNIVDKYIDDLGVITYVERQIGKNSSGDIISNKIVYQGNTCPSWAASLDI